MAKIIVDSRESRSGVAQMLQQLGAEVVQAELECGDYILAEGLGVERKAAVDFVASILDRRIFSQAALMKQTFARPFIVVEGDVHSTRSAITEEALLGALSYLSVIEGIQIVHTRSTSQTAAMLMTMRRHAVDGLGYEIALRGAKPKDRAVQVSYLVEGLPGIGPTSARKLLAHFGTASRVLTAQVEELRAVPGVGPKTAAVIREVLDLDVRR